MALFTGIKVHKTRISDHNITEATLTYSLDRQEKINSTEKDDEN